MSAAESNVRHIARVKRDLSADLCSVIDTVFGLFGKKQETVNPATLDSIVKYAKIVLGYAQQIVGVLKKVSKRSPDDVELHADFTNEIQELLQRYVKGMYPKYSKKPSVRVTDLIGQRSISISVAEGSVLSIATELIHLFGHTVKCRITSSKIFSFIEKVCDDALMFFLSDNSISIPIPEVPVQEVQEEVDDSPVQEDQVEIDDAQDEVPPLPSVPPPQLPPADLIPTSSPPADLIPNDLPPTDLPVNGSIREEVATVSDVLDAVNAIASDETLQYLSPLIPALQSRIQTSQTVLLLLK